MNNGTLELEENINLVRINNGSGSTTVNFRKLKFFKSAIVQGITSSIPNTTPTLANVLTANNDLTTDVSTYCTSNFAYGTDWQTTTRYICYESNRDIMNAAGANVSRLHAQVDVYEIVKSTTNAF
jgi:hypothetical protein